MQEGLGVVRQRLHPEPIEGAEVRRVARPGDANLPVVVEVLEGVEENGAVAFRDRGLDEALRVLALRHAEDATVRVRAAEDPGLIRVVVLAERTVADVPGEDAAGQGEALVRQAVGLCDLLSPDCVLMLDALRALVALGGEVQLDVVEASKLASPALIQRVSGRVLRLQRRAQALVGRGCLGPAVATIDEGHRLAIDLGIRGGFRVAFDVELAVTIGVQVLRELGHVEVRAVLVHGHEDVVAALLEVLCGAHEHALARVALSVPPALAPVVHEVMGQAPLGGLVEAGEVVLVAGRIVIALQGRIVDATHPSAEFLLIVPGVPVEVDIGNPGTVQGPKRPCRQQENQRCQDHATHRALPFTFEPDVVAPEDASPDGEPIPFRGWFGLCHDRG